MAKGNKRTNENDRRDIHGRPLNTGEYQRTNGMYEFRYVDTDGKRRSAYSWCLNLSDHRPASKRYCQPLREIEAEIQQRLSGCRDNHNTVDFYFHRLQELESAKNRVQTNQNKTVLYKNWILPAFGNREIQQVKNSDIKKFLLEVFQSEKVKCSTIQNICSLLKQIFDCAKDDEVIRTNPADGAMKVIPTQQQEQKKAITPEEQKRLLDFLKTDKKAAMWYDLVLLLLMQGLRIGEALALTWQDVNFSANELRINKTLVKYKNGNGTVELHINATKTRSGTRTLPMADSVRQSLKQRADSQANACKSAALDGYEDFVFFNPKTKLPWQVKTAENDFLYQVKRYNKQESALAEREHRPPELLPEKSFHVFRHTFCTNLYDKTKDPVLVKEMMGHSKVDMSLNVYTNSTQEKKALAMADFNP